MSFVIGIDPGREGAVVLLDTDGEIIESQNLPYDGTQTDHKALSGIYRNLDNICRTANPHADIHCYIEKIYTRPEDAGSEAYLKALEALAVSVSHSVDRYQGEIVRFEEAMAENILKLVAARELYSTRSRRDGRVGVLNYAKSAGILFMGATFGWNIVEVHPKTWCSVIKDGAPESLDSKGKSRWAVGELNGELLKKGSPLWHSERARKPHMGRLEAYLLGMYGRVDLGLEIVDNR